MYQGKRLRNTDRLGLMLSQASAVTVMWMNSDVKKLIAMTINFINQTVFQFASSVLVLASTH